MAPTNVSFSIRATTKRKRGSHERSAADKSGCTVVSSLNGVFLTAQEAAAEEIEAETNEQLVRPQKKALLLEDADTMVKRLQAEGNTLAEAGRFRAAMGRWQQAIAVDSRNAVIYELLAQAAMAVGDDFQGVQATELSPLWGEAYQTVARCHLNFGELELALHYINKAIELIGVNGELVADRDEIGSLIQEQNQILERRELEAHGVEDGDRLQVISCMKNLALRGRAL